MNLSPEVRRALEDLDIPLLRKLWGHIFPHFDQPKTDRDMLIQSHLTRAQARSIPFKLRAYSHRWLVDNGYPSSMPDRLRPKAERIYPKEVTAVGVAVKSLSSLTAPYAKEMEKVMSDVVAEMYADGIKDPKLIKPRMLEAAAKIYKV